MPGEQPAIVISGPTASGKTTLASAASEYFGISVIEEGLQPIFRAKAAIREAKAAAASQGEIAECRAQWVASHFEWLKYRAAQYDESPGFVADRWEVDLLATWLIASGNLEKKRDVVTRRIMAAMLANIRKFDLVVMMPFRDPFTLEKNEDSLKRVDSWSGRFLNFALRQGILSGIPNLPILNMPPSAASMEERLAEIERRLGGPGSRTA